MSAPKEAPAKKYAVCAASLKQAFQAKKPKEAISASSQPQLLRKGVK